MVWKNPNALYAKRIFKMAAGKYNMMANIIRLELLFKYGGVYADCDLICFKNIEPLLDNQPHKLIIAYEDEKGHPGILANTFMATAPGNPLIAMLIKELNEIKHILPNTNSPTTTGPKWMTKQLYPWMHYVVVLPSIIFYPEWCNTKVREPKPEDYPHSYGFHLWAHAQDLPDFGWAKKKRHK